MGNGSKTDDSRWFHGEVSGGQNAVTRSTSQKLATLPMAYGAMRQSQMGCDNRSRCAARQPTAMTVSAAPTNINWPISTPTLKNSNAVGIDDGGKPTSASAPANPNPCISPNVKETTQGQRAVIPGVPRCTWTISRATKRMLSAMHASTGGCGTWTQPRAAAVSVRLCVAVNADI